MRPFLLALYAAPQEYRSHVIAMLATLHTAGAEDTLLTEITARFEPQLEFEELEKLTHELSPRLEQFTGKGDDAELCVALLFATSPDNLLMQHFVAEVLHADESRLTTLGIIQFVRMYAVIG